jgi:RNA polymerase sigma-70 factor (ECF subfamily)
MEGLAVLYEAYRLPVFRTCLRMLGEPSAAEDAAQEVFLRVFDRMATFRGRSAFSTWLYRLTINSCLNLIEARGRRSPVPLDDIPDPVAPNGEPDAAYARQQSESRLVRLLAGLSVEHRTILVLREIEDLSYQDIASVLAIPQGTVMSRLSRAREALKQLWLAEGRAQEELRERSGSSHSGELPADSVPRDANRERSTHTGLESLDEHARS